MLSVIVSILVNIDYRPGQQTINFTNETSYQCVYFELIQDNMVEVTESMLIRIQNMDGRLTTDSQSDIITFSIEDSDSKLVTY